MASAALWLNYAAQAAFCVLALVALAQWLLRPDRRRVFVVLALLALAILVLIGPIARATALPARVEVDVATVDFLLSGYFLLLFRDSLVPLGRPLRIAASAAVAVVAVVVIAAALPVSAGAPRSAFQSVAVVLLLATWAVCIGEPIIRFALYSIGRPAVESARLRALCLGYLGLMALILVSSAVGRQSQTPGFTLASDVVSLLIVPLLYASFSPPEWLRRIWAYPEQDDLRHAWHDLLMFSPDREALARKALEWGTRLVGGAAAFIVDVDGSILATRGLTPDAAAMIAKGGASSEQVVRMPLELEGGEGTLTIIAGPFTPVFGGYEVTLLRSYAVSITAGLNRVSLTERITALEKAKGEFLNFASHELRAPMTVIKGYLTMMAAGTLGDMPERIKSVVPMLVAKSDEVTSMIEQMIEASRLEDGRLALKKQNVDIAELTQDAIDEMQPMLTDHRLIEYSRPPRPVMTDVDPDRFRIVVRNLLSNAVKYSPAGADVEVKLVPDSSVATLAVTDHGIGIAKEDQDRLFTRFGRIETKANMHIAGTGLGLWLSREIARMHDGDLTVDSEVGKGSTFTLEIPLNSDSPQTSGRALSIHSGRAS